MTRSSSGASRPATTRATATRRARSSNGSTAVSIGTSFTSGRTCRSIRCDTRRTSTRCSAVRRSRSAEARAAMGIYEFGEPDLAAYVRYVAGFCLRYFAVAGGLCWFFHVWGRGDWLPYRIQQSFPGRRELAHEIRWSMSNAVCTGASTLFLLRLVRDGHTRMYFDAMDRGWAYFALSVLLGVAGYDAWFYWQHRLLHTRWLFRQAHVIHHRVTNPTPFATFAHHPAETFLGNAFFILFLTAVPMHPAALALVGSAIVA